MSLSDDLKFKIGATVAGALVVFFGLSYLKRKLEENIPQVVKDGAEAAAMLASIGVHAVTNPLDSFGIVSDERKNPVTGLNEKIWTLATEEDKNNGLLRNEGGVDFTLF